ncbi:MAG: metal ABC transporter permease, partial [Promethearchaeota archaeon]
AYQWSYKINRIILLSILFGAFSSFLGLFFSYELDLPSGATITIIVSIIFVISMILSPKRRAGKAVGSKHIDVCETCKKADIEGECALCAVEDEVKTLDHEH